MDLAVLEALNALRAEHRPVALLTWLGDDRQLLVAAEELEALQEEFGGELVRAVRDALTADRSVGFESSAGEVFIHVFNPPLRLAVVGAVHIAQALVPMAGILGLETTVIDPRRSFATAERFPGVTLDWSWPDEALERMAPDPRTAVITLTHDPKLDDPALHVALSSPAFYIGCLGSRGTHGRRLERLAAAGFDADTLRRIHGPLGLHLGGRSPAEIALSALAQLTAVLRGGSVT
jgi:xanthine dehydrogenase accessory factor